MPRPFYLLNLIWLYMVDGFGPSVNIISCANNKQVTHSLVDQLSSTWVVQSCNWTIPVLNYLPSVDSTPYWKKAQVTSNLDIRILRLCAMSSIESKGTDRERAGKQTFRWQEGRTAKYTNRDTSSQYNNGKWLFRVSVSKHVCTLSYTPNIAGIFQFFSFNPLSICMNCAQSHKRWETPEHEVNITPEAQNTLHQ